jgi:hypothetical protein
MSHYADRLEYTAIFRALENCQSAAAGEETGPTMFVKGSTE